MHSLHFTAESSSNGILERDFTVGDVPGVLAVPGEGGGRAGRPDRRALQRLPGRARRARVPGDPGRPPGTPGDRHRRAGRLLGHQHGHRDRRTVRGDRTPDHRRGLRPALARRPGREGEADHHPDRVRRAVGRRAHLARGGSRTVRRLRLEGEVIARQRGRSQGAAPGSRPTARSGSSPGTSAERSPHRPDVCGCGVRLASRAARSEPYCSIDLFAKQVRVAIVPRVLLHHVHQHPAQ